MSMKRETIEKWLNKQIKLRRELAKSDDLNMKVSAVSGIDTGALQIYKGLGIIAETLGEELETAQRECDCYPIERYFYYKGVKVFTIYQTLEEDVNGDENIQGW